MNKSECIRLFNTIVSGIPMPFEEKVIPLISDYLTEINYENPDKMINLIVQNPQLVQQTMPEIIDYYCRKFNIFSIKQKTLNSFNNLKTILYYE